jgi:hypothetical protein
MTSRKTTPDTRAAVARVHRNFWVLTTVAILATGSLYDALRSAPGPVTAAVVALSGVVAVTAVTLAARILIALSAQATEERPSR